MSSPYESQGAREGLWDIGSLVRGRQGACVAGSAGASLQPTVIANAMWQLGANVIAYCFSIVFGTDTAMTVTLWLNAAGISAYTPVHVQNLGYTSALNSSFQTNVAAVAPGVAVYSLHQLPAGFYGELLAPAWIAFGGDASILLTTPSVAANCTCSMRWAEMAT